MSTPPLAHPTPDPHENPAGPVPDWIRDWLNERKIEELEYFYAWPVRAFQAVYKDENEPASKPWLVWADYQEEDQIHDLMRKVKEVYDNAEKLFDKNFDAFSGAWAIARGARFRREDDGSLVRVRPEEESKFRARIFACVHDLRMGESVQKSERWIGGPVTIFRHIDGRGNDDFVSANLTPQQAKENALALLETNGASAYPANDGATYPTALLDDVAEQWSTSRRTVRRRLDRTDFETPLACYAASK